MAIGLLARVDRKVRAEHVERLLGDAECAPVARRAHHTRIRQSRDHTFYRRIHGAGFHDLIADETAFGTVAFDPALILDGLARYAISCEPRHTHVRGAGDDALLARRERQKSVARSEYVIHHKQRLAMAANGKSLHRGNPWLLDRPAAELVGRSVIGKR